jgi:CRP-like cAMP-binding protein
LQEKLKCINCGSREYGAFKCVDTKTLNEITREKISLSFQKKDIIFKENENATGFYCMETGTVRTYKTSVLGKIQTFQIVGKGKWLGFRDALS